MPDPDGGDGSGTFYYTSLEPYIKNRQMLNCPSQSSTDASSYGYNMWLPFQTDADIANQSTYGITDRVVLGDANNNYIDNETTIVDVAYVGIGYGYPNPRQVPRHNDGINYLFYDAHVKWMKPTAMNRRQWNPGWQNLSLQMSCTGATSTCPPP